MSKTDTLVSVVTPCHNAEAFVGETVRSVLAQTHREVEHVIVDDASRDKSRQVIASLVEAYPQRVRSMHLSVNSGGSAARNRGTAEAKGAFLMFLDADDVLEPDALAALVAALQNSNAGVAVCTWKRLRRGADEDWTTGPADVPLPSDDPGEALRGWIETSAWAPPCAVLWRREAYEQTGGWDESLSLNDDGDLMMRALAAHTPIVRAAGGGALYRQHDARRISVSQSFIEERKLASQVRVFDKLSAILKAQGRLASFAPALGIAYQKTALLGFQSGHVDLARECERRGRLLAGRQVVSPKLPGRVLELLFGLERKELLVQRLAALGLVTKHRRQISILQKLQHRHTA